MSPMKITANIITLNEEENIKEAIESVRDICDEIVVVDSFSSDRTCEVAESLGAKVIKQKYLGDGPQKAFGVQFASNRWILSLDADERLDDDAKEAIKQLDLENSVYDGYSFARKTFVGKQLIKVWYPDRVVRLYDSSKCGFSTAGGHAKVDAKNVCDLNAHILHYSYKDYAEVIKTTHKFITRGAKIAYEEGKRVKPYDPFLHGVGALFKSLILKKGILYGVNGLNIAVISAFSSYMKYALILEMQQKTDEK